jgi:hypothetical protein
LTFHIRNNKLKAYLDLGLIDKNDTDRPFEWSNGITLEHLKTMNKKFAFIAVPKSSKKVER